MTLLSLSRSNPVTTLGAFWMAVILLALLASDGQAFTLVWVPSCRNLRRHTTSLWDASASTDNSSDDDKQEPTVVIQGDAVATTNETTNSDIFGLTAAMATITDTPLEVSIENVKKALLDDMKLINRQGDTLESASDIAPLVQGQRVALYFGAGWCPQCRELEYMLPQYMLALKESGQAIQLIYVPSDRSLEFQLDRMQKLEWALGVPFGPQANALKAKYGIWAGAEAKEITSETKPRRSGIPAFVVLDTQGNELAFLDTEKETIAALGDWPLDDPKGIF